VTHFTDPLFPHAVACLGGGKRSADVHAVTCLACRKAPIFWRAWRAETGERRPALPGDLPRNDPPHPDR
jgi:hypothetical protein